MGTRANFIIVIDEDSCDHEMFYENIDGYPDVLGSDLVDFLSDIQGLSRKELISFFEDYGYEHTPWGMSGDIEYYYEVFPERGTVSAYKVDWRTGTQTLITEDLGSWLMSQETE